jgi:hypothetical protein
LPIAGVRKEEGMAAPATRDIVVTFSQRVQERLDESKLEGAVRLDDTHTVVIIRVKDKGPIHAHIRGGLDDQGVENVISQIQSVPSLKGLVKES